MADAAQQPLVFRVLRLTPPELVPPRDGYEQGDLCSDALAPPPPPPSAAAAAHPFAPRLRGDAVPGDLLSLPMSFGAVYLGTQFAALITITNVSSLHVQQVGIRVELATERGRAPLFDNLHAPLPGLPPRGRQEFVVRHDVKELGTHTLTTQATLVGPDGSERTLPPQAFRFSVANPLVVRTRHRVVGRSVLLEVGLHNATKAPLVLEGASLQAAPPFAAVPLPPPPPPAAPGPLGGAAAETTVLTAEGGAASALFRLTTPDGRLPRPAGSGGSGGGTPLGRMLIRWRGPMGEPAVLQTQPITLAPPGQPPGARGPGGQPPPELELGLGPPPRRVVQLQPFWVQARVRNLSARAPTGPLRLALAPPEGGGGEPGGGALGPPGAQVVLAGAQPLALPPLPPDGEALVPLQLLALGSGTQRLGGLLAIEEGGRAAAAAQALELYVLPAAAGVEE